MGKETNAAEIPEKQSASRTKVSDTDQTNTGAVHWSVQRKHLLGQRLWLKGVGN